MDFMQITSIFYTKRSDPTKSLFNHRFDTTGPDLWDNAERFRCTPSPKDLAVYEDLFIAECEWGGQSGPVHIRRITHRFVRDSGLKDGGSYMAVEQQVGG